MKFCTRTKGLSEDQNKEFAKALKKFTQKEAEKFKPQEEESDEE